jgi:hypothetical protein
VSDALRRLLVVQRRRLVAAVLNHAERELYPSLSGPQREAFRTKFISAVDAYHDLMLDILGSSQEDQVVNVEAMELLRDIRAQLENT